ncbi:SPX domain-containing protein, partial [Chaetomium sp. MPI-SDFR-AT-0129]
RFAKELDQDAVPEWRVKYLNYKAGKKHVKAVTRAISRANASPILARKGTATPVGTQQPRGNTPASFFGISHHFTPPRKTDDGQRLYGTQSPVTKQQGDERLGLAGSPGSGIRYGSFGPSASRGRAASYASGRQDFALPAPAIKVPSNSGDGDRDGDTGPTSGPLPRSASMAATGQFYQRSPSFPMLPSSGPPATPRQRLTRLFSAGSEVPRHSPSKADIGMQNLDYVRAAERDFFAFLDGELNKIETFYREKEEQATDRLAALRAQLHEMRNRRTAEIAESKRRREENRDNGQNGDDTPARPEDAHQHHHWIDPIKDRLLKPGPNSKALTKMTRTPVMAAQVGGAGDPGKDYVRRPSAAVHDVPYRTAKRKLKLALQEFYRSLELLKSYALLNRTAFRKLNKKYDKGVNAKPPYRYMNEKVNKSWFVNSDILDGHIRTVEDLYARYFERGNHKIAAGKLRALHKSRGDWSGSAFRSGLMIGVGAVFAVQGLSFGSEILFSNESPTLIEQTSYLLQLYGGYFLVLLLFTLFTLDCRIWLKNKVNYPFIFEFDARNFLDWKQVAEFPAFFFALFGVCIWLNFARMGNWEELYLYYPVILIGISLVIIFLPVPILHHKARTWFLYSHYRLLLSGLYPVEFRDFFLAIWDLFMDFSLLQAGAHRKLLRNITAIRPVWIYYAIMIIDPILRFSWIFYAIFTHRTQHSTIVSFLVGLAEVFRRGMWTLLRVENEHCANVAQYKASRDTPLPYHLEQFVQRPSIEAAAAAAAAVPADAETAKLTLTPGTPGTPAPSSLRPPATATSAATTTAPSRSDTGALLPPPTTPSPGRTTTGPTAPVPAPTTLESGTATSTATTTGATLPRSTSGVNVFRNRRSSTVGKRSILQAMAEAHKQDFEKRRRPGTGTTGAGGAGGGDTADGDGAGAGLVDGEMGVGEEILGSEDEDDDDEEDSAEEDGVEGSEEEDISEEEDKDLVDDEAGDGGKKKNGKGRAGAGKEEDEDGIGEVVKEETDDDNDEGGVTMGGGQGQGQGQGQSGRERDNRGRSGGE